MPQRRACHPLARSRFPKGACRPQPAERASQTKPCVWLRHERQGLPSTARAEDSRGPATRARGRRGRRCGARCGPPQRGEPSAFCICETGWRRSACTTGTARPVPAPRAPPVRTSPGTASQSLHLRQEVETRREPDANPASRSGGPRTHWHPRRLSVRSCRGPELAPRPRRGVPAALALENSLRGSFSCPHPAMRRLALPRAAPAMRSRSASRAGSWSQSACVACGVPRKAHEAPRSPRGAGGGSAGLHGGARREGWAGSELLGTTLPRAADRGDAGRSPGGLHCALQVGGFHIMKQRLETDADQ